MFVNEVFLPGLWPAANSGMFLRVYNGYNKVTLSPPPGACWRDWQDGMTVLPTSIYNSSLRKTSLGFLMTLENLGRKSKRRASNTLSERFT